MSAAGGPSFEVTLRVQRDGSGEYVPDQWFWQSDHLEVRIEVSDGADAAAIEGDPRWEEMDAVRCEF
ncbi:MAG: hypothetical protein H0V44_15595 [Planctomycetes bacterium]|nr:hypothetical protein [Planctomycetota bacterium]